MNENFEKKKNEIDADERENSRKRKNLEDFDIESFKKNIETSVKDYWREDQIINVVLYSKRLK